MTVETQLTALENTNANLETIINQLVNDVSLMIDTQTLARLDAVEQDINTINTNVSNELGLFYRGAKHDKNEALFTKTSPTSITIPGGLKIESLGIEVSIAVPVVLDLNLDLDPASGSKIPGTDYYVYLKPDGNFILSSDKTITTGRLIGGFHYSLVSESEPPLPGVNNGTTVVGLSETVMVGLRGINKYSLWDLSFRAASSNDGMVYVNNKWYDIYLTGENYITDGTSKAGVPIVSSSITTSVNRALVKVPISLGGDGILVFAYPNYRVGSSIASDQNKDFITASEYTVISTSVANGILQSSDSPTTHIQELMSVYGIEQVAGEMMIWLKDTSGSKAGIIGLVPNTFLQSNRNIGLIESYSVTGTSADAPLNVGYRFSSKHLNK